MRIRIYLVSLLIFLSVCRFACIQYKQSEKYKKLYIIESNNYKATIKKNRYLLLTNDQLKYQQDSILHRMDSVVKANKIKKPQSISYINEAVKKKDTIRLKDTIFVKDFKLDTIIGDKWFNTKLHMEYPSTISVEPSFNNEKYIVSSLKKEFIKPKKKWPFY